MSTNNAKIQQSLRVNALVDDICSLKIKEIITMCLIKFPALASNVMKELLSSANKNQYDFMLTSLKNAHINSDFRKVKKEILPTALFGEIASFLNKDEMTNFKLVNRTFATIALEEMNKLPLKIINTDHFVKK